MQGQSKRHIPGWMDKNLTLKLNIMTLNQWLSSPNKNYAEGVALYKEHKGADQYYNYFLQVKTALTGSPHFSMLLRKLQRVARIAAQYPLEKKETVKPAKTQRSARDIKVQRIDLNARSKGTSLNLITAASLRKNPKYVNKVLTLKWSDLQQRDKEVFFSSQAYFESKQNALFLVSKTEQKLKGLHAQLKSDIPKSKKVEILSQAKVMETEKVKIFEQIDTFKEPEKVDPIEAAKKEATKKAIKKGQLPGYIRKAENALKDPDKKYTGKVRKNKEAKIKAWKKELEALKSEG